MKRIILAFVFLITSWTGFSAPDPYYIKSAAFHQGGESLIPIFRLGESFRFSFDDLMGNEADYYYKVVHCTRDWKVSDLKVTEYFSGIQNSRIVSFQTSFNTFQPFVHYTVAFPNRDAQILISGNFILEIYNDDSEKILERRFVLYEDIASVAMELKRPRALETTAEKQNVYLTIDFGEEHLQNPKRNVNVVILQNGQWHSALTGLEPQYIIGNKFQYQYDEETNFWAGNEYLFFDNSDIRQVNNTVSRITRNDLFEVELYPRTPLRGSRAYVFFQDVNGAFKPRNKFRGNDNTEADYVWVHFTYKLEKLPSSQKLFIVGMFNDYQMTGNYELEYDPDTKSYKTALLLKQGFTNYKYVVASADGNVLEELNPDGNFVETENIYHTLVYYRGNVERYDRIIGLGKADSTLITN